MIGTWDIKVTLRNCQTGASARTLRAINTFGCGGVLIETGGRGATAHSQLGQGMWQHLGGHYYRAVLQFFRFNRDGSLAGTQRVTRHIELSDDGNEFTATASVEDFDANNNITRTNCATEKARRLE
jgi:hypothetical protein